MTLTVIAIAVLLLLLILVSYVERVYTEMGKFLSREYQENIEVFEHKVEPRLWFGRERAATSIVVLQQIGTATVALLVGYTVFADGQWSPAEWLQAVVVLALMVVVFNRLIPYMLFARTRGEWVARFTPVLRMLIVIAMPVTLVLGFFTSVVALTREPQPSDEEAPFEAVDAFIEAGQEEGIIEEGDRDLIHSVVQFGDKTVRDVMTPRPEIVAVPSDLTVEAFTEMLRQKPYSRVPVFEGSLDNIRGIVFAHDVLQVADTEARTRTVSTLMRGDVHYVPESKYVSELLREMQRENVHMAIVIDEYGGVAGVVTIEDLVEEIVGEIRDEHEAEADIVRDNEGAYVVPGNMDVDRLDELFGVRPDTEATTVAGLVSETVGRIPQAGEVVELDSLRFEVLESTERRVERLRISQTTHQDERSGERIAR